MLVSYPSPSSYGIQSNHKAFQSVPSEQYNSIINILSCATLYCKVSNWWRAPAVHPNCALSLCWNKLRSTSINFNQTAQIISNNKLLQNPFCLTPKQLTMTTQKQVKYYIREKVPNALLNQCRLNRQNQQATVLEPLAEIPNTFCLIFLLINRRVLAISFRFRFLSSVHQRTRDGVEQLFWQFLQNTVSLTAN